MKLNLKGVSKGTWVRIIALFLVLVNQVCIAFFDFQLLPYDDEQIYEGVSTVLTIVVTLWSTWKNNSFSRNAQEADDYLNELNQYEKEMKV